MICIILIFILKQIKEEAQEITRKLGLSLSDLLNSFLRQIVKSKKMLLTIDEEPSDYLIHAIKEARQLRVKGKSFPKFTNAKDAIKWIGTHEELYNKKI